MLIALWVRSYYVLDEFSQPTSLDHWVGGSSIRGQLQLYNGDILIPALFKSGLRSFDAKSGYAQSVIVDTDWEFSFDSINGWYLLLPHWFLALLCATLAAAPWMPWPDRFGLRTLLIATTLIAVVLGLVVMFSR
jgi:hypothetical protein